MTIQISFSPLTYPQDDFTQQVKDYLKFMERNDSAREGSNDLQTSELLLTP